MPTIQTDCYLYLVNASQEPLGVLNGIKYDTVDYKDNLLSYKELSFELNKYINIDGSLVQSNFYTYIKELMYIYVTGVGNFRIEDISYSNDGYEEIKKITCNSCEVELTNQNLVSWKINTGEVSSLEYLAKDNVDELTNLFKKQISVYNEDRPDLSLLDLAIKKSPYWSIGYVDPLIKTKVFRFDVSSEPIYSFLIKEFATNCKAICLFDIKNRTINVYSVERLDELGKTDIVLSYKNLLQNIEITKSNENIYTRFNVSGSNDLKINSVNFNESYLEDLSHLLTEVDEDGNYIYADKEYIQKYLNWYDYRYNENTGKRNEWVKLTKEYNQCDLDVYDTIHKVQITALDYNQYDKITSVDQLEELRKGYILLVNTYVLVNYRIENGLDKDGNKIYETYTDGMYEGMYKIDPNKQNDFEYSGYWEDYKIYVNIIIPNIDIAKQNAYINKSEDKIKYIDTYESDWDIFGTEELEGKIKAYNESVNILQDYSKSWEEMSDSERAKWTNEIDYTSKYKVYIKAYNRKHGCELALNGTNEDGEHLYKFYDSDNNKHYYIKDANGENYYYNTDWGKVSISVTGQEVLLKGRKQELEELQSKLDELGNKQLEMIDDVAITNPKFGLDDLSTIYKLQRDSDYVNDNILTTTYDDEVTQLDTMEELFQAANKELYIESQPQYSFTTTLDNMFKIPGFELWSGQCHVGNIIHLMLNEFEYVKLRIVSIERKPFSLTNELTLTYSNMIRSKDGINDYTNLFESAITSSVNQITSSYVKNFDYESIFLNEGIIKAIANSASLQNSIGNIVTGTLTATDGVFDCLTSKYVATDQFEARLANVDTLKANSAFIDYLENELMVSTEIRVDDLKAKLAQIDVAEVGSLFTESLQSTVSTSVNSTVNLEFVKTLIAGNATIGDLFTNNFTIGSDDDGSVIINGSTMQFKDSNDNVYIQLGTDEQGGHSLIVNDSNGTTLLDGNGITQNAISDGLIVNDMVKKKDVTYNGITSDALDINDITTSISSNSNLKISANRVYYDKEDQSLNTLLSSMETKVNFFDGKLKYEVIITSSNGTAFKGSTVLTANVYDYGTTNIVYGTFLYQWYRNGIEITNAIGSTLTVTEEDGGAQYTCKVTYE